MKQTLEKINLKLSLFEFKFIIKNIHYIKINFKY